MTNIDTRTKEKREKSTEQELFALNFKITCAVYGMSQKELARKAFDLDHINTSYLLNGKKQKLATYRFYSDKLSAFIADNPV
jgi:hypothetical protein